MRCKPHQVATISQFGTPTGVQRCSMSPQGFFYAQVVQGGGSQLSVWLLASPFGCVPGLAYLQYFSKSGAGGGYTSPCLQCLRKISDSTALL